MAGDVACHSEAGFQARDELRLGLNGVQNGLLAEALNPCQGALQGGDQIGGLASGTWKAAQSSLFALKGRIADQAGAEIASRRISAETKASLSV